MRHWKSIEWEALEVSVLVIRSHTTLSVRGTCAFARYRSGAKHDAEEGTKDQEHARPTSTIKTGGARDFGVSYG